jgi:hypothetical protein
MVKINYLILLFTMSLFTNCDREIASVTGKCDKEQNKSKKKK